MNFLKSGLRGFGGFGGHGRHALADVKHLVDGEQRFIAHEPAVADAGKIIRGDDGVYAWNLQGVCCVDFLDLGVGVRAQEQFRGEAAVPP